MPNRPSKKDHPIEKDEQSDRSSGEEAAHREEVQQDADPQVRSNRNQSRKGQRDQDDGGQSGHVGRDQNSR